MTFFYRKMTDLKGVKKQQIMIEYNQRKGKTPQGNKDKKYTEGNIMKKANVFNSRNSQVTDTNTRTYNTNGGDFMKKVNGLFKKAVSALSAVIMVATSGMITKNASAVEEPDLQEMAEQIVVLVNEARAEEGLDPIYAVPYLFDVAEQRAEECVEKFDHKRADGSSYMTLVDYDKAPWAKGAENIANGMSTPEATFEQWRNSPSHWAAIMNPNYTHMGVGVCYDADAPYHWYWQQLFIQVDTYEVPSGEIEGQYIPDKYKVVPQSTGDLDGDGIIDSFDYVLLCRYLNKQVTLNPLQIESADILVDGVITYSDAAYLRKFILGQIDSVPVQLF